MSRTVLVGVLAVALLGAPGLAEAASGVLVLPLEHAGLPTLTVGALDRAVRAEVKASLPRLDLLPPPALGLQDLQLAAGCVDASPKCLAGIGRTLRASRVVRVMTRGTAERLIVKIMVVRTKSARAKEREAELLDVDEDSANELRWHVAKALGASPGPLTGKIELYTASKVGALAGAELLLDDQRVPAGALDEVTPGQRRVEVRQQGFETFIWLGQVRGGRTTRVAVRFEPKQAAPAPPPPATPPIGATARPDETPPIAEAPPAAPAPAPVAVEAGAAEEGPTLVFTWVFAAGAVVAASAGTIFAVQTQNAEREVGELFLACEGDNPVDADHEVCRRGQRSEKLQFAMWGTAIALGGAAVAAFFLEDGPTLFDDDVAFGIAPNQDGVAASFRMAF